MSSINTMQRSAQMCTNNGFNGFNGLSMSLVLAKSEDSFHSYDSGVNQSWTSSSSSSSQVSQSYNASNHNQWKNFSITLKDISAFKRLLDEQIVEDFLNWDKCCLLADKYLIATALTYFKRAELRPQQFTPCYLFVALYLAHDMEEDDLDLKNDLVRFAMCHSVSNSKLKLFLRKRDKLWHAMGFRAAVNHLCCEALMQYCLPTHKIWRRERNPNHGGVSLPMHVKNIIHKELRLAHSYLECNIRCIVCESRRFMHFRKFAKHDIKPIVSSLSADSAPFVPQTHLSHEPYLGHQLREE